MGNQNARLEASSNTSTHTDTTGIGLQALDVLDNSIVIFDKDWKYVFVNKFGLTVLNKPKEDVIGKKVWDLLPHLDKSEFKRSAYDARKHQIIISTEEYFAHRREWFRTTFYPFSDMIMVKIINVTALKQEQEVNAKLSGALQEAMEIYWSDANKKLREQKANDKLDANSGF